MKVFLTTLPKSGTKLMERVLLNMGLAKSAGPLCDGQFISAHRLYDSAFVEEHPDVRFVFLIRDPRDVLVSMATYVREGNGGIQAASALRLSRSDNELQALLFLGVLTYRLAEMRKWKADPRCLTIRFEDIVADRFGGSAGAREATARRLGGWLGEDPARVLSAMQVDDKTSTFRRGTIGRWRDELAPAVVVEMDALIGDLLADWGYAR